MPVPGRPAETLWQKEEHSRLRSHLVGVGLLLLDFLPLTLTVALAALASAINQSWIILAAVACPVFGYIAAFLLTVLRKRAAIPVRVMHFVGATRAPIGGLGDVRDALRDMVLAAGLPAHPVLWVIESAAVNAMAASMGVRNTHIAVTRGMLDNLTKDEIRAVLAHLIARVAMGDIARGTLAATASGVAGIGYQFFDDWSKPNEGRPSSIYPRGHSKNSLRRGDLGAMFLLKDPDALISSLEAIARHDNLVGDWAECIGYLFVSWPYIDREIDSNGRDFDQLRIRELATLYGVWQPDASSS